RRRFARRQWLRRWLVWRYVIASVLLVALVSGAIWLVFLSSVLTVKHVDVQGESLLTRQQILTAARVPDGAHLADLDLSAIRSRVGALAPVRRVDVSRDWPDGVLIKVTERTAVAAVEVGGAYHAMDAEGVLFRDFRRVPPGMPLVVPTAGAGSAALAEAARVIASLPAGLAARVDHVQVSGVDQVSLAMRGGARVIWGSAAQSGLKAQVLARLLPHPAQTYDVSVPGQPVTSAR
ncbi:MAG: FtsQ-type POTRA domain-containing protein, partial [Nocardioides sp.]